MKPLSRPGNALLWMVDIPYNKVWGSEQTGNNGGAGPKLAGSFVIARIAGHISRELTGRPIGGVATDGERKVRSDMLEEKHLQRINVGERHEVKIEDLSHAGEGVGRLFGLAVFIAGAMPGDTVLAEISEVKRNFAKGHLVQIIKPSPDRVESDCPVSEVCGGCQLRSLAYPAQLEWKRNQVYQALKRIGGFAEIKVRPTLGMADPCYYRNNVQLRSGNGAFGFYARGSNEVVPLPEAGCRLPQDPQNKVVRVVSEVLGELEIDVTGLQIRSSRLTGEVMLVFVTRTQELARRRELVERVRERAPEVTSLYHNVNPKGYGPFLGKKTELIWGKPHLIDQVGPYKFQISPHSFFQVNSVQTEVLYGKALEFAGLTGTETVYDLYCGIGTISLFLAAEARRVIGIEEVSVAVEDARANVALNGAENAEFVVGRVEVVLPRLVAEGARPDVVVLDPPRAGAAPEVLEAIAETKVKQLVYVSCNPATLARDLRLLAERGYEVQEAQPVDMFPHMSHVETIARIQRADF